MGAFQSGFQMGGEIYNNAERMRLAEAAEKRAQAAENRAQEQFGWQREEQEGKKGLRQAALEYANTGDTVPVMSGQGATGGIDEGGFTIKQEPITAQQKMDRFRQRALALGASLKLCSNTSRATTSSQTLAVSLISTASTMRFAMTGTRSLPACTMTS